MGEVIAFLLFTLVVMIMFSTGIAWIVCSIFHIAFSLPVIFAVWSIWIIILFILGKSKES